MAQRLPSQQSAERSGVPFSPLHLRSPQREEQMARDWRSAQHSLRESQKVYSDLERMERTVQYHLAVLKELTGDDDEEEEVREEDTAAPAKEKEKEKEVGVRSRDEALQHFRQRHKQLSVLCEDLQQSERELLRKHEDLDFLIRRLEGRMKSDLRECARNEEQVRQLQDKLAECRSKVEQVEKKKEEEEEEAQQQVTLARHKARLRRSLLHSLQAQISRLKEDKQRAEKSKKTYEDKICKAGQSVEKHRREQRNIPLRVALCKWAMPGCRRRRAQVAKLMALPANRYRAPEEADWNEELRELRDFTDAMTALLKLLPTVELPRTEDGASTEEEEQDARAVHRDTSLATDIQKKDSAWTEEQQDARPSRLPVPKELQKAFKCPPFLQWDMSGTLVSSQEARGEPSQASSKKLLRR